MADIKDNSSSYYNGVSEEELRESEMKLNLALEVGGLIAWSYDIDTEIFTLLNGTSIYSNKISMEQHKKCVHPDDLAENLNTFSKLITGEAENVKTLFRFRHSHESEYRYFECNQRIKISANGKKSIIGIRKDITDDYRRRKSLEQSKLRTELAIKKGNLVLWEYDAITHIFKSYNDPISGYNSIQDIKPDTYIEYTHPNDRKKIINTINIMDKGVEPYKPIDIRFKFQEVSEWQHCNISGVPIEFDSNGRAIKYVGIRKDNTLWYNLTEELAERNAQLKMVLKAGNIIPFIWDIDSDLVSISNSATLLENDINDNKPKGRAYFRQFILPEDHSKSEASFESIKSGNVINSHEVIRLIDSDKNIKYYEMHVIVSAYDIDNKPSKAIGYLQDITERKKNELIIQAKEKFLQNILNNVPFPVHIKDMDNGCKYIYWNEASSHLFGDGMYNDVTKILKNPEEIAHNNEIDYEVYRTGKPYFAHERITLINGRTIDTIVRKCVIYDNNRRLLLIVRWDVTVQNELKRQSKFLSLSTNSFNTDTWYCDTDTGEMVHTDGYIKKNINADMINTIEKYASFLHPDDKKRFLDYFKDVIANKTNNIRIEYRIDIFGSGNYRWTECRGAFEDRELGDGKLHHIIYGINIDINNLKKNELALIQSKNELNKLVEQNTLVLNNINSALIYVDKNHIVQWENVQSCFPNIDVYKRGELCYKSTHGIDKPCEKCIMKTAIETRKPFCTEYQYKDMIVELRATPVYDDNSNEAKGVILRIDDITKRKQFMEELQKAKDEAERSDKLKSSFIANMSHEIRTPLNAIVGFSSLLLNCDDDDMKNEYSKIINLNNDLLLKLINDILDLSKMDAGFVELKNERFSLTDCIKDIYMTMSQRVDATQVEFTCENNEENIYIVFDRNRLTQLYTNFITNAIKYTPSGFIKIGYTITDSGIKLYVKDSGIGIDDDKKDKVFMRFEKLDEFAQGTGLGLSICKAIAESAHGEVSFDSEKGKGSTFYAYLPCRVEHNSGKVIVDTNEPCNCHNPLMALNLNHQPNILIAEDIDSNYLLIHSILNKYHLVRATNGIEAVAKAKTGIFDIIFMDIRMPQLNGIEATRMIREFNPSIPIIALTANAFDSDKSDALQAGCNMYITKPVRRENVLNVIKQIFHC